MKLKMDHRFKQAFLLSVLLLLGATPLFAQFTLESNLGVNLFDIVGSKVSISYQHPFFGDATAEQPINMSPMACFGVTFGYQFSSILVALEVSNSSGDLAGQDLQRTGGFWGTGTLPGTSGTDAASFFMFGPAIRYYFLHSGVRPFLGAAFDLGFAQITLPFASGFTGANSFMLEVAGMGGALFDITPSFYVGLHARTQYFFAFAANCYNNISVSYDQMHGYLTGLPLSLVLSAGYKI